MLDKVSFPTKWGYDIPRSNGRNRMTQIYTMNSAEILATFALDVYRDPNTQPRMPIGWQIYMDCPGSLQTEGYFGSAYYSVQSNGLWNNVYIIIAHCGTNDKFDIEQDLKMSLLHKIPSQFINSALPFIKSVIQQATIDFPDSSTEVQIGFTGHSLGATLSELSIAAFMSIDLDAFQKTYPNFWLNFDATYCANFESTGSLPLITTLYNDGYINDQGLLWTSSCTNYLSDINAINTCFEHITEEICVYNVGYDYIPMATGKLPSLPNDPIYWFKCFTIADQHHMKKIYDAIINDNECNYCKTWPVGFEMGFDAYLNYNPEVYTSFHRTYWDNYIQKIWIQYPELHSEYKYFFLFKADFVKDNLKHDLTMINDNANKENSISIVHDKFSFFSSNNIKNILETKLDIKGFLSEDERSLLKNLYSARPKI